MSSGVLRIQTPLGPRYIKPNFTARIYLMWVFRNFHTLPAEVLSRYQKRLIDRLCGEQQFASRMNPFEDAPILGTLESRPVASLDEVSRRKPNASIGEPVAPYAADGRNRS